MHSGLGIASGALGAVLTAYLQIRGGFARLAAFYEGGDGFSAAAEGAVGLVDTVILGGIVCVVGALGAGAVYGGLVGRNEEQWGATAALVLGIVTLGLLTFALATA